MALFLSLKIVVKGVGVFKIFHWGQKCRSNIILHYTTEKI